VLTVAIAGCDGAGKSTLVRGLAAALAARGIDVEVVDKWDIFDPAAYPECAFLDGDRERLKRCVASMQGIARALFVLWMIAMTLKRMDDRAGEEKIRLLDGYWMKHAAAEIVLGCPADAVLATVRALPLADLTLFLDLPPEAALRRKPRPSRYECGCDARESREAFFSHQSRVRALLSEWTNELGWVRIDSEMPGGVVLDDVLRRVLRAFETRESAETVAA